jgi:repressor of nif and glnA expression
VSTAFLRQHSTKIRHCLTEKGSAEFLEFIRLLRDCAYQTLRSSKDQWEIAKAQGEIKVLDRILGLKEEIDKIDQNNLPRGANV